MKGKFDAGTALVYGILLLAIIYILSNPVGITHILNSLSSIGK